MSHLDSINGRSQGESNEFHYQTKLVKERRKNLNFELFYKGKN